MNIFELLWVFGTPCLLLALAGWLSTLIDLNHWAIYLTLVCLYIAAMRLLYKTLGEGKGHQE